MIIEITAVTQDRKERKRYNIYTNGQEEALFSVHEDILIKYQLLKGKALTSDEITVITDEDDRYRAYALAVYYLGFQARTRKQIEQYLRRKELEPEPIAYALERLESEHIVDDGEYARQFAMQRIRYSQKGSRWIKQELQQRGISNQAASDALDSIDKEDELASAVHAAKKKWRSLKGENREKRHKLMAFLLRRGFPTDAVKQAVKAAIDEAEIEQADEDEGLLLDN
ncbi:RecX family transcriptional regulator [Paenibacillus glycanilyticus]|uniref:RecX family transcriptional regulator n=1 Tax=Paenibacillus glycanilyticus TaxID=126569 RepID=UPI00203C2786|nr:RecX family transcriptional regulator [Paenibacillus glycanilyticus]MCM3625876.1 RecX family transcriptional regulator [Paenibacillus glycanilyticus]